MGTPTLQRQVHIILHFCLLTLLPTDTSFFFWKKAELRWQAFTSLAYGAKGVLYFMYWAARDSHLSLGGTLIYPRRKISDPEGEVEYVKGPHYYQARRINSVLKVFGRVLLHATSDAVFLGSGTRKDNTRLPQLVPPRSRIFASINNSDVSTPYEFLVGQFILPDGRVAVLLQNQDEANGLWASVKFVKSALPSLREVDPSTGEEGEVYDESPFHAGIQLGLGAGDARLFISSGGK